MNFNDYIELTKIESDFSHYLINNNLKDLSALWDRTTAEQRSRMFPLPPTYKHGRGDFVRFISTAKAKAIDTFEFCYTQIIKEQPQQHVDLFNSVIFDSLVDQGDNPIRDFLLRQTNAEQQEKMHFFVYHQKFLKAISEQDGRKVYELWSALPQSRRIALLEMHEFLAFIIAAQKDSSSLILKFIWENAGHHQQCDYRSRMIEANNYQAFLHAISNEQYQNVCFIWESATPEQRDRMLSFPGYEPFQYAGHSEDIKIFEFLYLQATKEQRYAMVSWREYDIFLGAAENDRNNLVSFLLLMADPEQRLAMLSFDTYKVFEEAYENQFIDVMDTLWSYASEEQIIEIKTIKGLEYVPSHRYREFHDHVMKGKLAEIKEIHANSTPAQWAQLLNYLIEPDEYEALMNLATEGHTEILQFLVQTETHVQSGIRSEEDTSKKENFSSELIEQYTTQIFWLLKAAFLASQAEFFNYVWSQLPTSEQEDFKYGFTEANLEEFTQVYFAACQNGRLDLVEIFYKIIREVSCFYIDNEHLALLDAINNQHHQIVEYLCTHMQSGYYCNILCADDGAVIQKLFHSYDHRTMQTFLNRLNLEELLRVSEYVSIKYIHRFLRDRDLPTVIEFHFVETLQGYFSEKINVENLFRLKSSWHRYNSSSKKDADKLGALNELEPSRDEIDALIQQSKESMLSCFYYKNRFDFESDLAQSLLQQLVTHDDPKQSIVFRFADKTNLESLLCDFPKTKKHAEQAADVTENNDAQPAKRCRI